MNASYNSEKIDVETNFNITANELKNILELRLNLLNYQNFKSNYSRSLRII